jgi:hypothetical protein
MIFWQLFHVLMVNRIEWKLSSQYLINVLMLLRSEVIEEQGELSGGFPNLSVFPNQD